MNALRVAVMSSFVLAIALGPVRAQDKIVIRLATLAPAGSIWHKALQQMGADWSKATEGRVSLIVYAGGSQGTEDAVLLKMGANQLQAAGLTGIGLTRIDGAFNVFSIPFFLQSDAELFYLVEKLEPTLKDRLAKKAYVLLNWGNGGWVQVFSTKPVQTLAELKKLKLFTSAGDDRMVQWYKNNGFNPAPLAVTDIYPQLASGGLEVVPFPPLAALSYQWYKRTPYMLDISLAPVVGATVITQTAWSRIPEADRSKLVEAAKRVEATLQAETPRQDKESVAEMQKAGLKVTRIEATGKPDEWRRAGEAFAKTMRGDMVPSDIFDMARRELDAFRQRKANGSPR